jgi:hypothetical protein
MNLKKKIIVNYLISKYDKKTYLKKFLYNYKKFNPGYPHKLIITFKNFKNNDIIFKYKCLKNIKHEKFIDFNLFNDFDWGSYKRLVKKFQNSIFFFMNCHSYPIKSNWLKFFVKNYKKKSLLGPAGSYESLASGAFKGIYYKNRLKSLKYFINNFIYFPIFPNPHIRSNSFMISGKDFLNVELNKKYKFKKFGTWINESGRKGMTNNLKKKGFNCYVINSDGKKFSENNWRLSETFCYKEQSKLLISDKFSRIFNKSGYIKKKIIEKNVWGYIDDK